MMKKISKIASNFLYLSLAVAMVVIVVIAGVGRFHHHDSQGRVCICAISHIAGDFTHKSSHHHSCCDNAHHHLDCEHHPDGSSDCPTIGDGLTPFGELPRAWFQSTYIPTHDLHVSAILATFITAPQPAKSVVEAATCEIVPHILSRDTDNAGMRAPPVA